MKKLILVSVLFILSKTILAQPMYSDSLTFESTPVFGLTINPDTNNQWQIGKPAKTVFTNTISGNAAIVTDTANTYVPGVKSSFVLDIATYLNSGQQMYYDVAFIHSINTDSLAGGYIELSFDSINWFNVFTEEDSMMAYWGWALLDHLNDYSSVGFDTLYNSEAGFTGNFTGADVFLSFGVTPVFRDGNFFTGPPLLRFTFISDSLSTPGDGWMLDNFYLFAGSGGSVKENLASSIKLYPNPSQDVLGIIVDEKLFNPVTYRITDIKGAELAKGEFSKTIDVSKFAAGAYFISLLDNKGNAAAKMFYKQ